MPVRQEDLNQSSRLDLDYDILDDVGESNSSPGLNQIVESGSISSDATSAFLSSSSVDSTVEVEAVSDFSSEGLRGGGQRRQQKQHSPHAMNGVGRSRNIQRESTHSTIDSSSSSSRNGEGTSKKMVKIKLWDPGDSSAEPTVITVAMDMPSNQELGDMHALSLGVGQKIQLCQQKRRSGRNTDGGEKTVDISWQPQPRPKEEVWEPPLIISKEDQKRADSHRDYRKNLPQSMPVDIQLSATRSIPKTETPGLSIPTISEKKTETSYHRTNQPQSIPVDIQLSATSIPKTETPGPSIPTTTEKKTDTSESLPTLVKGLEPFTIPSILSSTIIKSTPTEKVGLAFRKATGTVVIEKIVPGSLFDGTALRPGYECLCINGHRLRSARRAAEIVRDSGSSLTLVASNAPRPPGTMYTMISLKNHSASSMTSRGDYVLGMYFKIKHGLVQLVKMDADSPIVSTSMKVGDYVLAINGSVVGSISKAVEVLSESSDDIVPMLYFNMRQLRVSLVDKVIGDLWKKEWSDGYDECVVLQPGNASSNPLTLRFKEEGMCELLDPLRAFRDKHSENVTSVVPPDHPLNSVVETLNHGIICVLSAIKEGVELATTPKGGSPKSSDVRNNGSKSDGGSGGLIGELAKLSGMYKEGLLSKDDFEAIKSKLLKS